MSDQAELRAWIDEDTGVPEIQAVNSSRMILRLLRRVVALTRAAQRHDARLDVIEQQLGITPPPPE